MIISRGRRYIFVHIPKTGGTALTLSLEGRAMKDDILIGDTPKAKQRNHRLRDVEAAGRLWKHSRLADIRGLVTDEEIAEFFVFTLVRNPWDRMVSYYHWLQVQTFDHPAVTVAQDHGFSQFIHHPHTLRSIGSEQFGDYVKDAHGDERCSLFARIEHLQSDLAPLEEHLGFNVGSVERINTSARDADYRRYYTDDDAALIAAQFAPDIQRFGYSFL